MQTSSLLSSFLNQRGSREAIAGAERVLGALEEGQLRGISTTILFGEIRYVYLRENKAGFEIACAAIEAAANFQAVAITVPLAIHAAELGESTTPRRMLFPITMGSI